ncbi:hypothetical protein GS416_03890 [Rhodococcus hoagii]|nr:hypothetical protein [Prescottella equi]
MHSLNTAANTHATQHRHRGIRSCRRGLALPRPSGASSTRLRRRGPCRRDQGTTHKIRSALGHTRPRHVLPTPCPRADCGLRTLTRTTGMAGQPDFILCEVCGYAIRDGDYPG